MVVDGESLNSALLKARSESACSCQYIIIRRHSGLLVSDCLSDIKAVVASLNPILDDLHGVTLVGSTAYNMHAADSDIDLVLVSKENSLEAVCGFVFEQTIECSRPGENKSKVEYTVLTASQVEELFRLGSPFAFSLKYGNNLYDDGFLASLYSKPLQALPVRRYYLQNFFEHISSSYFNTLKTLETAKLKRSCNSRCCQLNSGCKGFGPAEMLFKLIVRMLYLTLPYRGLMPLTKNDAIDFAKAIYPKEILTAIDLAVRLSRKNSNSIVFTDYKLMKKAAVHLFREIVAILGWKNDVRRILHDAANAARGDFYRIQSSSLKNCFV